MTFDLEEQEKIDALKDWWKRYGTALILVVLVVFASVAAIHFCISDCAGAAALSCDCTALLRTSRTARTIGRCVFIGDVPE